MRILVLCLISIFATPTLAAVNHCQKPFEQQKAIDSTIAFARLAKNDVCQAPEILEIQVEPTRIVKPDGEVIPHYRVQYHYAYHSCLFLVSRVDQSISKHYCYSAQ